jgi:uncharacterized protein (DUF983 family)
METVSATAPPATPSPSPHSAPVSAVIWKPEGRETAARSAGVLMRAALWRGCRGLCPVCGKAPLFAGFLRVRPACSACAAPLGEIRADDAPPYFTVFIVAHLVIGLLVLCERNFSLSIATEMMLFLPSTLLATLALIRPVKGATVGAMWKLGFMSPAADPAKVLPDA